MSPADYFRALCKAEAGEFVYRIVENVTGIYVIRPRLVASDLELLDRFVMEDPFGYSRSLATAPEDYFVQPPIGVYQFLEVPASKGSDVRQLYRYERGAPVNGKRVQVFSRLENGDLRGGSVAYIVHRTTVDQLKSRYGYVWRGIRRPHDRESGIAGGELAVVDLETNQVLGLRRGFARTRPETSKRLPNWETAAACSPELVGLREHLFIKRVLKPAITLSSQ